MQQFEREPTSIKEQDTTGKPEFDCIDGRTGCIDINRDSSAFSNLGRDYAVARACAGICARSCFKDDMGGSIQFK